MKKTLLCLTLASTAFVQMATAQNRTVTGVVKDASGEALLGVTVKTSDDRMATQTDENGEFSLTIPEGSSSTLQFSFMGLSDMQVPVTDFTKPLNIVMGKKSNVINEVVVVGNYLTTSKEKWTGVGNTFGADRIEKFPVTDITKTIEGSSGGIQVTNGSGQPGSSAGVRIRGLSSISAGNAPLYVVDGAIYEGDITSLNPGDIESVTTLADATATSLFGSRGAGGVIAITTKRGKRGRENAIVTFETKFGMVNRMLPDYKVIKDPGKYYEIYWDALRNQKYYGKQPDSADLPLANKWATDTLITALGGYNVYRIPNNAVVGIDGKLNPNAGTPIYQDDWNKELSRQGYKNEHLLAISGASEKTDYYFSLGYLKETGYIKKTDYDRITTRLNINTSPTSWLNAGLNISGALSNYNTPQESDGLYPGYNPFFAARIYAPIYPVYYRDTAGNKVLDPLIGGYKYDWGNARDEATNSLNPSSIGTFPSLANRNVLGSLMLDDNKSRQYNFTAVPYLEVKFLKQFKFKTLLNTSYYSENGSSVNNPYYGQFAPSGGNVGKSSSLSYNYTFSQSLNWSKAIDKHYIDALVAHESYLLYGEGLSASRSGLGIYENANLTGAAVAVSSSSSSNSHRTESYISRLNYDYDNTYFLSGSFRYDGNSRLHPSSRWGSFWSLGAGVNLHKLSFMSNTKNWLDYLKYKVSYGTNGNERFSSYYIYQRLYVVDYPNGSNPGALSGGLGNPDLKWETKGKFNTGIEFGLLDRVITGDVNFYIEHTDNQYYNLPISPSLGVSSRPVNLLNMKNMGYDVNLGIDAIRNKNFNWNIGLTGGAYKNTITKMPSGLDSVDYGSKMLKKGHSIDEWYLVDAGVDKSTGAPIFYYFDANGERKSTTDYDYAYLRGRKYSGSTNPDFLGTVTNNITYRNFGLSFMFSYGIGGKYYDQNYAFLMNARNPGLNFHEDILKSWTFENKNSDIPRNEIGAANQTRLSTRFLIDASFLSFRNINIYYNLPVKWTSKIKISGIKIFASVDNIYVWSKRKGMDPQASFSGTAGWTYPPSRTIIGGLRLTL